MQKANSDLIMIIEDETPLLRIIQKKLQNSGFQTVTAVSAEQALDYLKNMEQPPDLIWLDYFLPKKSGLEFVMDLKKDPKLSEIPVFVISNTAGRSKVDSLLALGVEKYFVKAEKRLEDIVLEIKLFLEKRRN